MRIFVLYGVYLHIVIGAAADVDDFSNNLASDLGPLLSLFGDSMTKQFLSESITFLDYIIFAVAPIGILTAVVSAIRLCGSTALRAFIGRSQEGQGAVEAELCTSTSRDVCELFTRGGIQRVLGRPSILELVYFPRHGNRADVFGDAGRACPDMLLSKEYFSSEARMIDSPWKELGVSTQPDSHAALLAPNPNLSLNIGIRRPSDWIVWAVALLGIVLQCGVLALAGVGVWVLEWNLTEGGGSAARNYAPIMFIVGTTLLCAGMWGCAFLIGQTTQEIRFQRKNNSTRSHQPRLLWVQPGPQVIGDQSFDPFAYLEDKNAINVWLSSRRSLDKRFELYTYVAVLATLVGYIVQFIGIRGMKAWVSLAHLGVTVVMSILRGGLRTQRLSNDDNQLRSMPDMVAGHELDWLTYRLGSHDDKARWHVTGQHAKAVEAYQSAHEVLPQTSATAAGSHTSTSETDESILRPSPGTGATVCDPDDCIVHVRTRLANLTGLFAPRDDRRSNSMYQTWKDEHIKVRKKARQLSSVFNTSLLPKKTNETTKDIDLRILASGLNGK